VLAADACDRAGLELTPTRSSARAHLRGIGLGAGTSVANPLEVPFGPDAPDRLLRDVIGPILEMQPYASVLVHANAGVYYSYSSAGAARLIEQLSDFATAPLETSRPSIVLRNLHTIPGPDADWLLRTAADLDLSTARSLDEGAAGIAALARFASARVRTTV
jgi:hypothetical protein